MTDSLQLVLSPVLGALGGIATHLLIGYAKTRQIAADSARDLAVDVAGTLNAAEHLFSELCKPRGPLPQEGRSLLRDELVKHASDWSLANPSLELSQVLPNLNNEELHRLCMNWHDRLAHFRRNSALHREAYYWLLDLSKEADPSDPSAVERIHGLDHYRARCTAHCRDILQIGYELLQRLSESNLSTWPPLSRRSTPPLSTTLRRHYKLSPEQLSRRAAYYRIHDLCTPYCDKRSYSRVALSTQTDHSFHALCVRIELEPGRTFQAVWRPDDEVALPHGKLLSARARLPSGHWETVRMVRLDRVLAASRSALEEPFQFTVQAEQGQPRLVEA